ncbi:MAG: polyprenyl synthetase family protein [Tranquillimonas sp.]
MNFADRLACRAAAIDGRLLAAMRDQGDLPVAQAMAWAAEGGKRLRGFLVIEGAALHGLAPEAALQAAAAIEAMHAYSLVHDDLPAMDDDAMRRGRPTLHVKWDEPTAILAGDALQSLAFELLADPACHRDAAVRADLVLRLARAAGAAGMVRGQALDIAAETAPAPLTLAEIEALQAGKTGALIRWSGEAGAILAGADPAPLGRYAAAIGLAFQIADDILDVAGDAGAAGKRLGKDAAAGKATFVSLLGMQGARRRAADQVDAACAALDVYGPAAGPLRACARYILSRDR